MKVCAQKILMAIELVFSVAVVLVVMLARKGYDQNMGFLLNSTAAIIVNILYFSVCILCGLELFFIAQKVHFIRLLVLLSFIIVSVYTWIESPQTQGVSAMMVTCGAYGILLIVAIIKCPNKLKKLDETTKKQRIKLPTMFGNYAELAMYAGIGLPIGLAAIFALVYAVVQENFSLALRIFAVLFLFIVILTFAIAFNFNWKLLAYEKTLDYQKLEKYIKSCYKCNISDDKRCYLQCFEVNFMYNINEKAANKLFLSIIPPKNSSPYMFQYKIIELTYLLNNEHHDQFNVKFQQLQATITNPKSPQQKILIKLAYMQKAILRNISPVELDINFPETINKNKLMYLNNIYVRALVFDNLNAPAESFRLKEILKTQAKPLTELYNYAIKT